MMKNFKELKSWQKRFGIVVNSFALVAAFSSEVKLGLSSQTTRAAVSIPSNSAEGAAEAARTIAIALLKFLWVRPLNSNTTAAGRSRRLREPAAKKHGQRTENARILQEKTESVKRLQSLNFLAHNS